MSIILKFLIIQSFWKWKNVSFYTYTGMWDHVTWETILNVSVGCAASIFIHTGQYLRLHGISLKMETEPLLWEFKISQIWPYLMSSMALMHCKYAKVRSKRSILSTYSCSWTTIPSLFVSWFPTAELRASNLSVSLFISRVVFSTPFIAALTFEGTSLLARESWNNNAFQHVRVQIGT